MIFVMTLQKIHLQVYKGFHLQNLCDNLPWFWSKRSSGSPSQEAFLGRSSQVPSITLFTLDHLSISSSLTSIFSSLSSCTSQRRCSSRAGRRPPTERPLPPSWHERQHQVGGFVVKIKNLTFFNFPSAAFLLTFPPSACLGPTSSLRSKTRK